MATDEMKDAGDVRKAGGELEAKGEPMQPPGTVKPLEAPPFTEAELEAIPDAVPCLFHVDGQRRGEGMMPRGVVGMLAGPPGAGKSFLALDMMLAASKGGALFGDQADGVPYVPEEATGRVLYLSFEDDRANVGRRLRRILGTWKPEDLARVHVAAWDDLEGNRALFRMNPDAKSIERTELFHRAQATLEAPGDPWSLIVVDTLARSARGGIEQDAEAATDVVQYLEQWTKLPGNPVVLVLHHTRKGSGDVKQKRLDGMLDPESVRGSSAITGAVRWTGMLAKMTVRDQPACPTRNVVFEVGKANAIAEDAMPRLYLTPGDGGVLRRMKEKEREAFDKWLTGNSSSKQKRKDGPDFEGLA